MTQKILDRLPEKTKETMKKWNVKYNDSRFNKDITRGEIRGYVKGLEDAGLLKNHREFMAIFCYMTL